MSYHSFIRSMLLQACLLIVLNDNVNAQPCPTINGAIYGTPGNDEYGYCLAAAPDGSGFFVGGVKNDSALIVKMSLDGDVLWSRTFDIVPNRRDNLGCLIVDSEFNLVFCGIAGTQVNGGTIFVAKYNPATDQMVWSGEIVTSWTRSYNYQILEKSAGSNYLILNNPHNDPASDNDAELLEIDRTNGTVVTANTQIFSYGSSENISELILYSGAFYGVGRYTEGGGPPGMRHAMTKLDINTYDAVWTKLGHVSGSGTARLYGQDVVIINDEMYSSYHGDPDGTSTSNTNVFIQKTDLDGDHIWLRQYDFPGNTDLAIEMLHTNGGIVMYAYKRDSPSQIIMFKIDYGGNVLWSYQYQFTGLSMLNCNFYGQQLLIEVGGQLVLTAFGTSGGNEEMIVLRTDLDGNAKQSCVDAIPISIAVTDVTNPVIYDITPGTPTISLTRRNLTASMEPSNIQPTSQCALPDTLRTAVDTTICVGDVYEGYTQSGTYINAFITSAGCDSIHTLHLTVVSCQSACGDTTSNIFGTIGTAEHGRCVASTFENDGVYVVGNINDSTLLMKLDLNGRLIWSKAIDVIAGQHEEPTGILVDAIGMIAVCGTAGDQVLGGTIFVFRYDPGAQTLLWSNEYSHSPNDFSFGITEKRSNGNYLLANQPTYLSLNFHSAEVMEINRNTGNTTPAFRKTYEFFGTETLFEIVYHNDHVYGAGRYKDGGLNIDMRNTLVKLNAANGSQVWVRMGHQPNSVPARLYCTDLVIYNNSIYSMSQGDPSGPSASMTNIYIQRTDLDGNLIWLNQYQLPGNNDIGFDLAISGADIIAYAMNGDIEGHYIFKIDPDGNVMWAKSFQFNSASLSMRSERGNPLLVQAGNKLVLTGQAINGSGDADVFVIMTDLDGVINSPCVISKPISIPVTTVMSPVFYAVMPQELPFVMNVTAKNPPVITNELPPVQACVISVVLPSQTLEIQLCTGQAYDGHTETGSYIDTLQGVGGDCDTIRYLELFVHPPLLTYINAAACEGETFLGYDATGMYADTFISMEGCDSVRLLNLTLLPSPTTLEEVFICEGEQYEGYTITGTYIDTFVTAAGCDSIRTLILTVHEIPLTSLEHSICFGETYEGYDATGMYVDTFQGMTGCDSIRTLNLTVGIISRQVDVTICEGQSYEQYTLPGTYVDTIKAVIGLCDTMRTLHLDIANVVQTTIDQVICDGDAYAGYTQTGFYVDTLQAASGCDSIRQLNLEKLDPIRNTVTASACDTATPYALPVGMYIDTFVSVTSCDSVRILHLDGSTVYIPNVFSPNDDGINDVFTLTAFPEASMELDYFAIFDRFGDMVYETTSWPVIWKGDNGLGQRFQPGVFTYVFIYYCGKLQLVDHGDITLVK